MLVYTFRSFKYKDELETMFDSIFIFSKLKEDLEVLKRLVLNQKPRYVLGIAAANGRSHLEKTAVNQFNAKTVRKDGPTELSLYIPAVAKGLIRTADKPTRSFCNWTMYQLQTFILEERLDTKLMFVHINPIDLGYLTRLVTK